MRHSEMTFLIMFRKYLMDRFLVDFGQGKFAHKTTTMMMDEEAYDSRPLGGGDLKL